jgi:NNP family nitrate/nitrite transporter-like MFS transporter
VPVVYAVLLVVMAALLWFGTPSHDLAPGTGQSLREQVRPLRSMRVWRFSLYYVAVFGAYVALAAWLPTYYMDNFDVSLQTAALLTATYIFPASLLRPYGGHLSDRFGARRVMYWTFGAMLLVTGILMMPNGHIVISHPDGSQSEHLAYSIGLAPFAVLVFLLGCAMGVGKAAVFKHIPEYFPDNVGAVGGLVGMLGGLGGFFLPPLFAYTKAWSGFPSSTFFVLFVLTLACAAWMHWTVVHMLHTQSPELAGRLENPYDDHPPGLGVAHDRLPEEARA